jgi:hypothetical protein
VLVFLCMYEIHIYVAMYLGCYIVGCWKMFVFEKLDVINLKCYLFSSGMLLKMFRILKMS